MNYEEARKNIDAAYALINEVPNDRLDCINKALKLLSVLNGGAVFLNEVIMSPDVEDFSVEDWTLIHDSFCDSALPLVQMIEHFSEKMERETEKHHFAV